MARLPRPSAPRHPARQPAAAGLLGDDDRHTYLAEVAAGDSAPERAQAGSDYTSVSASSYAWLAVRL
jgi:hypothetical protein